MEVKVPRSSDRRVLRTRRMLRDALIALLGERGWDRVSVQNVCDRADVGRSTFYTHFVDKEDLLVGGLDDLRKMLGTQRPTPTGAGAGGLGFVPGLIEHVHQHQRLFRALIGKHSGYVVQKRFRQLLVSLVKDDLAGRGPRIPDADAVAHYIAGACLELLSWWLDGRNTLGPVEIEDLFRRLTSPVLAAARA
jgi:AcrR family transcriptional regulator